MGAPPRLPFEDRAAYVARALASGAFTSIRHFGNYAFGWWLADARSTPLPPRDPARFPTGILVAT